MDAAATTLLSAPTAAPLAPPSATPTACCVFRLNSGLLAIDARLVGEVAVLDGLTALPGCHPAVLGLANLRGRALAVVDLGLVLGDGHPASPASRVLRVLVLRLPGCEAGVAVERIEGVSLADPALRRTVNRLSEPAWIAAFQGFAPAAGGPPQIAALIDPVELAARLEPLRGAPRAALTNASSRLPV